MNSPQVTASTIVQEIIVALQSITANEGNLLPVMEAYRNLYASTSTNRVLTKQIFDELVKVGLTREHPLKWIERELHFEAYIQATGLDRKHVALNNLHFIFTHVPDDADLDLFNERINRHFL